MTCRPFADRGRL